MVLVWRESGEYLQIVNDISCTIRSARCIRLRLLNVSLPKEIFKMKISISISFFLSILLIAATGKDYRITTMKNTTLIGKMIGVHGCYSTSCSCCIYRPSTTLDSLEWIIDLCRKHCYEKYLGRCLSIWSTWISISPRESSLQPNRLWITGHDHNLIRRLRDSIHLLNFSRRNLCEISANSTQDWRCVTSSLYLSMRLGF